MSGRSSPTTQSPGAICRSAELCASIPVTTAVVTPTVQHNHLLRASIINSSTNNTLTVRFEDRFGTRATMPDWAAQTAAGFRRRFQLDSPSDFAYNRTGDNQNLMVTETNIVTPKMVNETRFQFTRSCTHRTATDSLDQRGRRVHHWRQRHRRHARPPKHFELQNYTSISHGMHTIRFGVRVRRESDQSNNPADSTVASRSSAEQCLCLIRPTRSSTTPTATK